MINGGIRGYITYEGRQRGDEIIIYRYKRKLSNGKYFCYIGTTKDFKNRKKQHKIYSKNFIDTMGTWEAHNGSVYITTREGKLLKEDEDYTIEVIGRFSFTTWCDANIREQDEINKHYENPDYIVQNINNANIETSVTQNKCYRRLYDSLFRNHNIESSFEDLPNEFEYICECDILDQHNADAISIRAMIDEGNFYYEGSDKKGVPCGCGKHHYHKLETTFDEEGNETGIKCIPIKAEDISVFLETNPPHELHCGLRYVIMFIKKKTKKPVLVGSNCSKYLKGTILKKEKSIEEDIKKKKELLEELNKEIRIEEGKKKTVVKTDSTKKKKKYKGGVYIIPP